MDGSSREISEVTIPKEIFSLLEEPKNSSNTGMNMYDHKAFVVLRENAFITPEELIQFTQSI